MALADTAALVATLELKDKFSRTARNAEGALGRLEAKTSTLGKIGGEAGRGLQTAGRNLARFGTIAAVGVVGGVTAATKAAIDFEDAFAGIRKTVDEADLAAAGLTFEDLSDSIRKMAREIPIAATELAAIGEAAGALGIAGEDIEGFTRVVAQLSVTTDLTSEAASTALGQLGNVLHLTGDDFEDFGDSLVALGNAGASTETQIVEMAARFGAAGNSAGLTKEEILALSSAVASMGIEVEAGGSALSRIFNNVATNIGTSSSKATAFADALGLSAKEFRTAWEEDALGTFEDFLAQLSELDQFEAASLLKKVGITNTRDVAAVKLMGQNVEFLNDQLAISENATGALGEEAAKKFATTASQIQLMKNRLTDVGITIGSAVLPKINELGKRFGEFLNEPGTQRAIQEFADAIPGVIDDLVGIAKGIPWGAIADAAEVMGSGARALLQAFTSLPPWVQTAVLTGWGLNKLTGGALGNIAAIIGKSAFGALRGATPANPVFVADVAGGAGVGGGAAAAGGRGLLGTAAKFVLGPAAAIVIGKEIAQAINAPVIEPAKTFEQERVTAVLEGRNTEDMVAALRAIDDQLNTSDIGAQTALIASRIPFIGDALGNAAGTLEAQRDQLRDQLREQGYTNAQIDAMLAETRTGNALLGITSEAQVGELKSMKADVTGGLTALRATTEAASQHSTQKLSEIKSETMALHNPLRAIETADRDTAAAVRGTASNTSTQLSRIESVERGTQDYTRQVAGKDFSPSLLNTTNVSVNLQAQITAYGIARALQVSQSATQTSFSGRGGDSRF